MGQKINPISLRLQKTNRKYDSSWYSNYHYGELFLFDLKVRDYLERILKQLKYPEGRVLISHFSKGSKINLFAFNPTSSRQQKLAPFGLKGGVRLHSGLRTHKQEGVRKLSPVFAKNFQHRNELKRPLKALSSKSKGISIDQELLLVNQSSTITCSEKKNSVLSALQTQVVQSKTFKQNTNKNGNKWNPFLPYLALSWYACQARIPSQEILAKGLPTPYKFANQGSKHSGLPMLTEGKHLGLPTLIAKGLPTHNQDKFSTLDEKTHTNSFPVKPLLVPTKGFALHKVKLNDLGKKASFSVNESSFLKPYLSSVPKQQAHNTGKPLSTTSKQVFNASNSLGMQSKTSKAVPSCFVSGTKCVPSDWQHNGSHLVPFFALKDTFNPSYLLKAKRLRDSCFALHAKHAIPRVTLCAEQKQQVVSKTLSLWYQRAQGSTHPILVSLGADKKTIPFLTKETSCKVVAKSNPVHTSTRKTWERKAQNKLLPPQPFPSISKENSLYRCHVEGVLDQQTGSSVKLVPFQVSTEKQSALFLAQEVVYFLEKRVSFRKIKDQILKELKSSKIIKGVRITCSGRVGGKSKKAQKAKTETVKQGQTSLGVFSSRIDFAQKSALTSFGLIGVKVWICFY